MGWTFDADLDDATGGPAEGGLALVNVRHDGHNFAKDIRTIGVWIHSQRVSPGVQVVDVKPTLLMLDSKFFTVSKARTLIPKAITRRRQVPHSLRRSGGAFPLEHTFDYLQEVDSAVSWGRFTL